MARRITVGAAQLGAIQKADSRKVAVDRMLALMAEGHRRGVELIVFPELALTTFFPRHYVENLDEADLTFDQAAAIIAHATSVLTDEEKVERDEIIARRLQAEAEEAERERLEALEAARAAVGEGSAVGQSASPASGSA